MLASRCAKAALGVAHRYASSRVSKLDELAIRAVEEGFLLEPDVAKLGNMISDALRGKRIIAQYAEGAAESEMEDRMVAAQDAYQEEPAAHQEGAQNDGADPFAPLSALDYSEGDANRLGYNDATQAVQLEVNALLLTAEKLGIDTDEIQQQANDETRSGTQQDYLEAARAALQSAIEGSNGDSSQDAGQPGNAGAAGAVAERLTGQTNQEIIDRQARDADAPARQQREQIEREAAGQTLTQQDAPEQRRADSGDMFAREKAQAEIDKRNAGVKAASDPNQGAMFSRGSQPFYSALTRDPFESKQSAVMASLKEPGTRAVQDDNGNWLLALRERPYTEQEKADAQQRITAINPRLIRAGVLPAVPLSDTPTAGMVWGRSIASTFGYQVTFIQTNRDFDGVAIGGRAFVSPNLQYPEVAVIGHEVLHALSQTDPQAYQALAEQIRPYLKDGVVEAKRKWEDAQGGKNTTVARAEEKVIADLNGAMWLDPKFWHEVARNDPN